MPIIMFSERVLTMGENVHSSVLLQVGTTARKQAPLLHELNRYVGHKSRCMCVLVLLLHLHHKYTNETGTRWPEWPSSKSYVTQVLEYVGAVLFVCTMIARKSMRGSVYVHAKCFVKRASDEPAQECFDANRTERVWLTYTRNVWICMQESARWGSVYANR